MSASHKKGINKMSNGNNDSNNSNDESNNNYKPLPTKSYEQLKEELIQKVKEKDEYNKNYEKETKLIIMEMITVLRVVEKKNKKLIFNTLLNDFKPVFGKTTISKLIEEESNPLALLEKAKEKEKNKPIMIATDGSQISEEDQGDDQQGSGSEDDIHSKREQKRQEQISKNIRKGSSQIPKMKPSLIGKDTLEGDDDDEDQEQEGQGQGQEQQLADSPSPQYETEEYQTDGGLLEKPTNIVIDDEQQIREIATIITQGKAIVITVDRNLEVTGIQEGKQVFDPKQVFEQS